MPIFSFYMGNIDTDSPTGFLTLGGVNQTHYEGEARATIRPFFERSVDKPTSFAFKTLC